MDGWIKLYRPIREHWIWKDPQKFQWWIDMLLSVNHSTTKVNIGMQLFECERGQSVMSLSSWAKRWNISKDKVRNFFVLLEKDHMITHESLGKSTRITICNYNSYQSDLHDSQTLGKQLKNAGQTQNHPNKNNNKENKDKNIIKNNNKEKKSYSDFVSMLPEEYENLCTKYTEAGAKRMIEILSNYKGSSGKKYKSDYLTILNWVVDRYNKELKSSDNEKVHTSTINNFSGDYSKRF